MSSRLATGRPSSTTGTWRTARSRARSAARATAGGSPAASAAAAHRAPRQLAADGDAVAALRTVELTFDALPRRPELHVLGASPLVGGVCVDPHTTPPSITQFELGPGSLSPDISILHPVQTP